MFDYDKLKISKNRRYINDLILLAVFVFICITVMVFRRFNTSDTGSVSIKFYDEQNSSPEFEDSISLNESGYYVIKISDNCSISQAYSSAVQAHEAAAKIIEEGAEYNILRIADAGAQVTEASCPDCICVQTGVITDSDESIICLPHRLVISVTE